MAGYTRQSSFADGDTITASIFNDEYNQLVNAFNNATGHKHDGTTAEGPVIGLIGDAGETSPNNKVLIDTTNNYIEFYIEVASAPVQQLYIADGAIVPVTDSDIDLGTTSLRFKDTYTDTVTTTGNVTVGGNLTVTGNATISGNLTFGDADTDSINLAAEIDSDIIPNTDGTYDLGSATKEWQDLYIDGTANIDTLVIGTSTGVTSVDTDLTSVSASDDTLASAKAIKTYIDAQVTAQDLDFQGDTGGALSIDLDSETLTIAGGTGIDTSGSLNTLTVSIDSTVATLTGSQTLTNKTLTTPVISSISNTGTLTLPTSTDTLVGRATTDTLTNKTLTSPVINTGVSGTAVLDDDTFATATATTLATSESIKAYVDAAILTEDTLAEMNDVNITTPADGALLFYDTATSKWIDNVVSGDITIADTGVAAISTGVIVNADINASAAISVSKTALTAGTGLTLSTNTLSVNASQTQITALGTIGTGTWQGTAIADAYVADNLTISGGTVNNTVIGGTTPAAGTFTTLTANTSITGTLATAAQPNITSVGTLSSLTTSGNVIVGGDLTVSGTTTTINTETINLADNQIVLNSNYTGSTPTENGGIEIERGTLTNKTLVWDETNDKWTVGSETFVAGTFEGNLTGNVTGNADTATTLATARDFSLTGDVTAAAVSFDGSGNVALSTNIGSNTVGITELNVTDGTSGQVLTTNGAGTLSFTTISSYSDSDVETYLDTGTSTPTFASAIVSGDLTVDTNTLYVNSTNNRVGIGTTSPSYNQTIFGSGNTFLQISQSGDSVVGSLIGRGGDTTLRLQNSEAAPIQLWTNNTNRMTVGTNGDVSVEKSAYIKQGALTSSSNLVAWDARAIANAYHATTENTTFSAPTNAVEGAIISVEIAQGATPYTVAWNTVFEFAASTAPTVTATANKTDIFSFRYNGSVWQEIGRVQNLAQT